jgi:hypothetical protein
MFFAPSGRTPTRDRTSADYRSLLHRAYDGDLPKINSPSLPGVPLFISLAADLAED